MRQALDKTLRKKLEDTVVQARDIVEQAVFEALQRLGVAEAQAPSYLSEEERTLRNKLRAHARQLGDKLKEGKQETERLINEMAYEHWHRMLFARYLEQNNLLMYDQYTPVTLDDCFELAEEEQDCKDGWELAGRLAQKMLPQIFRVDSPVFDIKLSMNRVEELESLIAQLDPQTYQAQDSLGWCYQFWQTKKKDQVNKSGVKIGAQELSPVTQLFTEPYMVSFLLDNALGAWWANKRLSQDDLIRANNEQELRELASIPGVPLEYLRFSKEEDGTQWKSAAGGFEKWPEHLSELKTLDPCCGSGHFLVAVFLMLVPMRMQLEGLSEKQAVDAVLRDNIHGLELDQRCVELAAFALALEAWRYPNAGGYRVLPELQLACSGMSITEAQKEWKDLAKGDEALTDAIAWMQEAFKDAPTLGSLLDPTMSLNKEEVPPWELLQKAIINKVDASQEAKAVAHGLAKAASLLSKDYQLITTNVPYLGHAMHGDCLSRFFSKYYSEGQRDLAFSFYQRIAKLWSRDGVSLLVWPQSWFYQPYLKDFRSWFINSSHKLDLVGSLGVGAFETISGEVVNVALTISQKSPESAYSVINASGAKGAANKPKELVKSPILDFKLDKSINKIGASIELAKSTAIGRAIIGEKFRSVEGLSTGDKDQYLRQFFEIGLIQTDTWDYFQNSPSATNFYAGLESIIRWEKGEGSLSNSRAARIQGHQSWGKQGFLCTKMGDIKSSIYLGGLYDKTCIALTTLKSDTDYKEVASIVFDESLSSYVREIDNRLCVATSVFEKLKYEPVSKDPILPKPYSNNPTQWIFHGHPCQSVIWNEESKITAVGNLRQDDTVLQVAVARLLGYQWPAELDPEMELAPEMREVMKKNADFAGLIDDDGIVCIPAVRGEKAAAKRLEEMLLKAYGDEWSSTVETNLLKAVKAKDLESWLRDKFFEQHCKLFQHRPFIWHVWDGLKDGFSALVNYHQLDYKGLERLIYTYLDDWISNQKRDIADGKDGADIRLTAAENLKTQLEAILAGEKGLDIFVRWKPLAEQPIGWNPDLNDGVRLNIRPFMLAKDVGKKDAGVLRGKPNIHWKKDRGTDVASAPWFDLGPVYGEKEGSRINDHHLSLAEKRSAREEANE